MTGTPEWMAKAECLGLPEDLFFPEFDDDAGPAVEVCKACPVRHHCLLDALVRGEPYGVWGGTTPRDRGYRQCAHDCGTQVRYETICRPCQNAAGMWCGTERGHSRHYRRKETVCQPCKDAHASFQHQVVANHRARRMAAHAVATIDAA